MTGGQIANWLAAAFTMATGGGFILSYSLLARWWRSVDGRMIMGLSAAITLTCALTTFLTLYGFTTGIDFLRYIQAGLISIVGITLLIYSIRVWSVQLKGKANDRKGR